MPPPPSVKVDFKRVIDAFPHEFPQHQHFFKRLCGIFRGDRIPIIKHDESFAELESNRDSKPTRLPVADLKVIDTDLKIQSQDGQNVLVFLKSGLPRPFNVKETGDPSLPGISATKELLKTYPPFATEDPSDANLTDISTDTSSLPERGVYDFDFGLRTVQNHRSEARGAATGTHLCGEVLLNHSNFEATMTFFQKITPVIQSCGALFEIVDPENYARYKASYDKIAGRSILCALRTTRRACWQGTAALINVTDSSPYMNFGECVPVDGWVAQACFGEFTGGALQVPELGIKLEFQPGDVVFIRPALLECTIADFMGERFGLVLYNHRDIEEDFDTSDKDTTAGEGQRKRKRSEEEDGARV